MRRGLAGWCAVTCAALILAPVLARPQSFNASISGSITDPSGAAVPGAEVTLRSVGTGATTKFITSADGLYHFGNLTQGAYDLTVSAKGFRDFLLH